jgi:hypothetical protein
MVKETCQVFFLSFNGSCLVSSSLSEVWQFEFIYCPQVPENSSVAHQLYCFGVGFSLCWFIGCLLLFLTPFLSFKVRDVSARSLLSVCYASLLIVFQFCSIVCTWMLFTVTGDELCGPLSALFQGSSLSPALYQPFYLSTFCLLNVPMEISSLLSLLLWCACSTPPLLLHVLFQFLFYYSFCFLQDGGGQSVQGAMLVFPRGGCGSTV